MSSLLIFAVPEEAGPFRKLKVAGPDVIVTGMGPEIARAAVTKEFDRQRPDFVVTSGFCGGLDPGLRRGDVLIAPDSGESLLQAAEAVGIKQATFHCADTVAVTALEKETLRKQTNRDAVEMESGVIVELCRERDIPVATIRVISDEAAEDLPLDFNRLGNGKGGINFGKLAIAIARHPGKIGKLMKLQKNAKFAAQQLAGKLAAFYGAI
ncbi:MAG: hypothetical protein ACPGVU_12925 [Limisphaerales bacterium]